MSKSTKLPVLKDRGWRKSEYWKVIRRTWKSIIKGSRDVEEIDLPHPHSIVNDYDYHDWISSCIWDNDCYCMREYGVKKCSRK